MTQNVCKRNKYGYCRRGDNCHFRHEKLICTDQTCNVFACDKRHPRRCSWFQEYGRCKFTSFCKFKHEVEEDQNEIVNRIKSNESKLIDIEKKS